MCMGGCGVYGVGCGVCMCGGGLDATFRYVVQEKEREKVRKMREIVILAVCSCKCMYVYA